MTETLPAPLVPAEIDMRNYREFPLEFVRLFKSQTWTNWTDRERVVGLRLWCLSWHEEPCGSLPDNDRALADHAGYGDSPEGLKAWKKVRPGVLEGGGWVRCADGRFYHHVVAEKALDKWRTKRRKESDNAADAARKRRKRSKQSAGQGAAESNNSGAASAGQTGPVHPDIRASEGEGKGIEKNKKDPPPPSGSPPVPDADGDGDPAGLVDPVPLSLDRTEHGGVVKAWNAMAERTGLASVAKVTQARRRNILARLKDCGDNPLEGIKSAIAKVEASAFLTGKRAGAGHENWRCNFDFFIGERGFTKIMEGSYDDRESGGNSPKFRNGFAAIDAEIERRIAAGDG